MAVDGAENGIRGYVPLDLKCFHLVDSVMTGTNDPTSGVLHFSYTKYRRPSRYIVYYFLGFKNATEVCHTYESASLCSLNKQTMCGINYFIRFFLGLKNYV